MADAAATKKTVQTGSGLSSAKMANRRGTDGKNTTQLLVIVLLFACCAMSAFFFVKIRNIVSQKERNDLPPPVMTNVEALKEAEDLKAMGVEIDTMNKQRDVVMQTARLAEVSGILPVAPDSVLASLTPAHSPLLEGGVPQIEPEPPKVTVLAVMILNKERVALVDVDGEDGGLIVRPGNKFSNGTARIVKIDAKGVTFVWRKKRYEVAMTRP